MKTEKLTLNLTDKHFTNIINYSESITTCGYTIETVIKEDITIVVELINNNDIVGKELNVEYDQCDKLTHIRSNNKYLIDYLKYNDATNERVAYLIKKYEYSAKEQERKEVEQAILTIKEYIDKVAV